MFKAIDKCSIVFLLALVFLSGCGGGGGSNSKSGSSGIDLGTAPKINSVIFINYNVNVGDELFGAISVTDPDLDVIQITANSTSGSETWVIKSQPKETMIFYNEEPVVISAPPGKLTVEFIAFDRKGNMSSAYSVELTVI